MTASISSTSLHVIFPPFLASLDEFNTSLFLVVRMPFIPNAESLSSPKNLLEEAFNAKECKNSNAYGESSKDSPKESSGISSTSEGISRTKECSSHPNRASIVHGICCCPLFLMVFKKKRCTLLDLRF